MSTVDDELGNLNSLVRFDLSAIIPQDIDGEVTRTSNHWAKVLQTPRPLNIVPLQEGVDKVYMDGTFGKTQAYAHEDESKLSIDCMSRPFYSYSELAEMAINDKGDMTVHDISCWIRDHFDYYRDIPRQKWLPGLRHALTVSRKTKKVRPGLGKPGHHLWSLTTEEEKQSMSAARKKENVQKENEQKENVPEMKDPHWKKQHIAKFEQTSEPSSKRRESATTECNPWMADAYNSWHSAETPAYPCHDPASYCMPWPGYWGCPMSKKQKPDANNKAGKKSGSSWQCKKQPIPAQHMPYYWNYGYGYSPYGYAGMPPYSGYGYPYSGYPTYTGAEQTQEDFDSWGLYPPQPKKSKKGSRSSVSHTQVKEEKTSDFEDGFIDGHRMLGTVTQVPDTLDSSSLSDMILNRPKLTSSPFLPDGVQPKLTSSPFLPAGVLQDSPASSREGTETLAIATMHDLASAAMHDEDADVLSSPHWADEHPVLAQEAGKAIEAALFADTVADALPESPEDSTSNSALPMEECSTPPKIGFTSPAKDDLMFSTTSGPGKDIQNENMNTPPMKALNNNPSRDEPSTPLNSLAIALFDAAIGSAEKKENMLHRLELTTVTWRAPSDRGDGDHDDTHSDRGDHDDTHSDRGDGDHDDTHSDDSDAENIDPARILGQIFMCAGDAGTPRKKADKRPEETPKPPKAGSFSAPVKPHPNILKDSLLNMGGKTKSKPGRISSSEKKSTARGKRPVVLPQRYR